MRTIKIQIFVFVSIILALLGLEEARWRIFYTPKAWPAKFDSRLGFIFTPGATVTHTNDVSFHVTQQANSLGFLDREPARVTDSCRVLLIGDSFVEAAQVPLNAKVQTLLMERSKTPLEVNAFGFSGTGQANQLPFYDEIGRDLKPDVAILFVVANDLANNSTTLEAQRYGWSPTHLPRKFVGSGIDPDWASFVRPRESIPESRFHVVRAFRALFPPPAPRELVRLDLGFCTSGDMPADLATGIDGTRLAFREWRRRADEDHFELLAFSTYTVIECSPFDIPNFDRYGYRDRVRNILRREGVPVVEQKPRPELHFLGDGHWSPVGHADAARLLLPEIERLCLDSRRKS